MKKKIIILGSTGSIGTETFRLIKKDKKKFEIKLLSTNKNYKKIYKQAKILNVKDLIITDFKTYLRTKEFFRKKKINIYNNFSVIDKLFKNKEIYYSMISILGLDGLDPTLKLIKYSKNIAIVNKEILICGWNLISNNLKKFKTNFFPIDSEHFSIFSILGKNKADNIDKVYITASGGPFLNYSKSQFRNIHVKDALKHPNWKMGKKISIDSSTMMNKLFEVIEAKKIFNIPYKKIKILIHPKSYVHSIIKFNNGFFKILIHEPKMKIPIYNSIYYEENTKIKTKNIDLEVLNNLNLSFVNFEKFSLLKILNKIPDKDSLFETVILTINDYFVSIYLKNKINYLTMIKMIKYFSNEKKFIKFKHKTPKNINDIYKARNYVNEFLKNSYIN